MYQWDMTWSRKHFLKKSSDRITQKLNQEKKSMSQNIYKNLGDYEYWWNLYISTQNVPHNKPDLVIWITKGKTCNIVEFSCPGAPNMTTSLTLAGNIQIMYPDYHYQITLVIIEALQSIPKSLNCYVWSLGFNGMEIKRLMQKLQLILTTV